MRKTESKELDEHNLIRMFLLHRLDDELREEMEEKFFCEIDFKERVLITEEELLEDFVLDNLTPEDRSRVKKYLLTSPAQMEKLRAVEEVIYSVKTFTGDFSQSEKTAGKFYENIKFFFFSLSRRTVFIPLFLIICFGIGTFLILNRGNSSSFNEDLIKKIEAMNSGSSFENTAVFELNSVITRGAGHDANQIFIKPQDKVIECDLIITQTQYKTYQVSLSKYDSAPLATIKSISLTKKNGANILVVRFPAEAFENADYQIKISGGNGDGIEELETFSFEVIKLPS